MKTELQEFFEGVQSRVSQGVKESEIGYQMAFSRAELRRVIKEYPAKEVKKGLEALYKKVDKHLSEEENLLQVCNGHNFSPVKHVVPFRNEFFIVSQIGCLESHARRVYSSVQVY